MTRDLDIRLLRLLHGESDEEEARSLERLIEADEAVARRWDALRGAWEGLEAEPVSVPLGFAGRIRSRAQAEARGKGWGPVPAWGRPLAAVAMAAGIALGLGIGSWAPMGATANGEIASVETGLGDTESATLAESYLELFTEDTDAEDGQQ